VTLGRGLIPSPDHNDREVKRRYVDTELMVFVEHCTRLELSWCRRNSVPTASALSLLKTL